MDKQIEGLPIGKPETASKAEIPLAGLLDQTQRAGLGKPIVPAETRFTPEEVRQQVEDESRRQKLEEIKRNIAERIEKAVKAAQMEAAKNYKGRLEDWEKFDKEVGENARKEAISAMVTDPEHATAMAQLAPTDPDVQKAMEDRIFGKEKKKESDPKIPFFEKVKNFFKKIFGPKPVPLRIPPPLPA